MFEVNSRSFYVTAEEGDVVRVEILEHHGMMSIAIGANFSINVSPDDAFDIADALTMIANEISSHTGEE